MRLVRVLPIALFACLIWAAQAQSARKDDSVREFVRSEVLEDADAFENRTTRFVAEFVDLDGDGIEEAVVYLSGPRWCGSGGCRVWVLTRSGSSWRLVTEVGISRPPVRRLNTSSHGWRSLTVWVQ